MGIQVRSAVGRFEDLTTLVGTRKPGAGACWCMSYRDARLSNTDRPTYMEGECFVVRAGHRERRLMRRELSPPAPTPRDLTGGSMGA
ncbi:hypothetical protein [Cellulomonas bogoriensis]|uniref:Uncharacterized protein n=1 Tax=Cellulomonas bogoriensis 69B4 = DSM 16987 TaxID=1386082 RepID=A0A0A0BZS0_9CELL|nr:hypothetical protein [Cellulomonas bogoriensis]KGM13431.1 hypothetical protein N869_14215 [Cellulomonas bogoriensis 69B4 = DSM 16987]